MLEGLSTELLKFAVRLYTRTHDEPEVGFQRDGFINVPRKILRMDNGERMIRVTLQYGPRWKEEE